MSTADAPQPGWTIRAYQPGDEAQVAALFALSFGRPVSEAHLRWKYHARPGPAETEWLAVVGERAIGHYAGYHVSLWLDGREQPAIVAVDGMVHPDFRRQGVYTAVVHRAHAHWREAGVRLVLGLPNEQWGSRKKALDYRYFFDLQWRIRRLRLEALLAGRLSLPMPPAFVPLSAIWNRFWDRRLRRDEALRLRPVSQAGPEFDQVWQAARDEVRISLVRDSAWLNWRYLAAPSAAYRLLLAERAGEPLGYAAYRFRERQGICSAIVAELVVPRVPARLAEALLAALIHHLYEAGAHQIVTLAVPGMFPEPVWRRAGFLPAWGAFDARLVPLAGGLPLEMMRRPENWLLMGGDFDVV